MHTTYHTVALTFSAITFTSFPSNKYYHFDFQRRQHPNASILFAPEQKIYANIKSIGELDKRCKVTLSLIALPIGYLTYGNTNLLRQVLSRVVPFTT